MPRAARVVIPGCPHHAIQRGNDGQDVFLSEEDRRAYLSTLKRQAGKYGLAVLGYCLMTNHVHIIATPSDEQSLSKGFGITNLLYAQQINLLRGRSGHLWQSRFYSCPLGEEHLWRALCYVERNPVRAGMVKRAWLYEWSSARAHATGIDESGLINLRRWQTRVPYEDWRARLQLPGDGEFERRLRSDTRAGRPLGSDDFVGKIERLLGRRLRPRSAGRPRNK